MNAEEAKNIYLSNVGKREEAMQKVRDDEFNKVMGYISQAANEGKACLSYNYLFEDTILRLEKLGYEVTKPTQYKKGYFVHWFEGSKEREKKFLGLF